MWATVRKIARDEVKNSKVKVERIRNLRGCIKFKKKYHEDQYNAWRNEIKIVSWIC